MKNGSKCKSKNTTIEMGIEDSGAAHMIWVFMCIHLCALAIPSFFHTTIRGKFMVMKISSVCMCTLCVYR